MQQHISITSAGIVKVISSLLEILGVMELIMRIGKGDICIRCVGGNSKSEKIIVRFRTVADLY